MKDQKIRFGEELWLHMLDFGTEATGRNLGCVTIERLHVLYKSENSRSVMGWMECVEERGVWNEGGARNTILPPQYVVSGTFANCQ